MPEQTRQHPLLGTGQGWGLGAPLLVHGTQELLHIGGQQVVHLVALDRGQGGSEAVGAEGRWGSWTQGPPSLPQHPAVQGMEKGQAGSWRWHRHFCLPCWG